MNANSLWLREFGPEWAVPGAIETALVDTSWGNDASPTFIRPDDDPSNPRFTLWVNHPDSLLREIPGKRFVVSGGSDDLDLLETDNAEEALTFLRNLPLPVKATPTL